MIRIEASGAETVITLEETVYDPLRNITALALQVRSLWIGTRFSGVLRLDLDSQTWQHFDLYNSANYLITASTRYWLILIAACGSQRGAAWHAGATDMIESFPLPDEGRAHRTAAARDRSR
ncbi:MAG: hypothetical protein U0528_17910 [Anaerolineae bacterium]